jgi:hypothetical protein
MLKLNPLDGPGAPVAWNRAFRDPKDEFVFWPAHDAEKIVLVWISIEELSRVSGKTINRIDSASIDDALQRYQMLIERGANALYKDGDERVVLNLDSLPSPQGHIGNKS